MSVAKLKPQNYVHRVVLSKLITLLSSDLVGTVCMASVSVALPVRPIQREMKHLFLPPNREKMTYKKIS
jgi:hypothetical protein